MGKVASAVRGLAIANESAFGTKQQQQLDRLTQKLQRQQEAVQKAANAQLRAQERQEVSAARYAESIQRQGALVDELHKKMESSIDAKATEESLDRVSLALNNARAYSENLSKAQRELYQTLKDSPTQEGLNYYRELQAESNETRKAIQLLEQEQIKLQTQLAQAPSAEVTEKLRAELDLATQKLDRLKSESRVSSDELQRNADYAAQHYERLASEVGNTAAEITAISQETGEVRGHFNQLNHAVANLLSAIRKIGGGVIAASRAVRSLAERLGIANKRAGNMVGTVEKLRKRILRLASAALVFNVFRRGFTQLRAFLWKILRTNSEFISSLALIKGNLLTAFQPIYSAAIPALNALAQSLVNITGYIAGLFGALFGTTAKQSQDSASSLYDEASAIDAVGDAAKKAANNLASFDRINVLTQDNAENSNTIVPDFSFDFTAIDEYFKQFETWPERFYQIGLDIADAINGSLSQIDWTSVISKATLAAATLAMLLNGLVDGVDWNLLGYSVGQGINTVLSTLYTFITTFNWGNLGRSLAAGMNSIITTVDWDLLGRTLASKWNALIDFLYNFIVTFDWFAFGMALSTAVNGWFDEIDWAKAGQTISNGILGLFESARTFLQNLDWAQIGRDIATFLNNIEWGRILSELAGLIGDLIKGIGSAIWNFLSESDIEPTLKVIATGILAVVAAMKIYNVIAPLAKAVTSLLSSPFFVAALAVGLLASGIVAFTKAWDGMSLSERVITIIKALTAAATAAAVAIALFHASWTAGLAAAAIVAGLVLLKNSFKSLGVNTGDITGSIKGMSSYSGAPIANVPSNAVSFARNDFSKSPLPKLATGAVIPPRSEFAAILGDQKNGRNLEAPEGLIRDIIREEVGGILSQVEISPKVQLVADPDMTALIRTIFPYIEQEKNRRGAILASGVI